MIDKEELIGVLNDVYDIQSYLSEQIKKKYVNDLTLGELLDRIVLGLDMTISELEH